MQNQVLEVSLKEIFPKAKDYFLTVSGISNESDKHIRMWKRALKVYDELATITHPKVIFSNGMPDSLIGKDLVLNGNTFTCNAFEQINLENIRNYYIYVLTVGNINSRFEQVMDQLYADIWGTSLVDALRDYFKEYIRQLEDNKHDEPILTQSFGPGYYGMDVKEIENFFGVMDTKIIDVCFHQGGMMLPEKSCAGIYLSIKDKDELPPSECESCLGSSSGCMYCNVVR